MASLDEIAARIIPAPPLPEHANATVDWRKARAEIKRALEAVLALKRAVEADAKALAQKVLDQQTSIERLRQELAQALRDRTAALEEAERWKGARR